MRTVLKLTILPLLAGLVGAGCVAVRSGVSPGSQWVERRAAAMGTVIRVGVVAPERQAGLEAIERALAEVRRLEAVLSSWRPDTEVGRINGAPVGVATPVSAELWEMLQGAREWSHRTGGAFDPAVGALIDAWDLRGAGRRPGDAELARALEASGMARFRFDPGARTVTRTHPSSWLDTGAFGKGVALAAAERALREAGIRSASLDFGGQLLVFGAPPAGGARWEVAVAHPALRHEAAGVLRVGEGSVSTTSQSERFVEAGGERLGHVLDPRSGRPVPAWGSVTVVARDPLVADLLSTALFVMGPEAGRRWAEGLDEVGVLFLEAREGEVVRSWNSALERYR